MRMRWWNSGDGVRASARPYIYLVLYSFCNIIICVSQAEAKHRRIYTPPFYRYIRNSEKAHRQFVCFFAARQHAHTARQVWNDDGGGGGGDRSQHIVQLSAIGEEGEKEIRIDEQYLGREPATAAPLATPIARNRNAMYGCQTRAILWKMKFLYTRFAPFSTLYLAHVLVGRAETMASIRHSACASVFDG